MQQGPKHVVWGSFSVSPQQTEAIALAKHKSQFLHLEDDEEEEGYDSGTLQLTEAAGATDTPSIPTNSSVMQSSSNSQGSCEKFLASVGFWSVGTAFHSLRKCRPCHYVHTEEGCQRGVNCNFCHLPHVRARSRPSKSRRQQSLHLADIVFAAKPYLPPQEFSDLVCCCSYRNPHFRECMLKATQKTGAVGKQSPWLSD